MPAVLYNGRGVCFLSFTLLSAACTQLTFYQALAPLLAMLETASQLMDFMQSFRSSLLFIASVAFLSGCDDEPAMVEQPEEVLPPALKVRGTPRSVKAEIYPAEGTRRPRPAVMVMAAKLQMCNETRKVFSGSAHVLCTLSGADVSPKAEGDLQEALRYLKEKYRAYTDSSPVFLVTDESFADLGWKMMLREPKFFGHAFLLGLSADSTTATTLSALTSGGAKTLVLDGKFESTRKLLKNVAGRGGLKLHGVGEGPEALLKGLALLKMSDPRTGPAHP